MIDARDFVDRARDRGFHWYAGVPCSFLTPFINYTIDDKRLRYISAANEGDALAIIAGAFLGGGRGVVMMQNSGLGNAVSPLASLTHIFRIPALLIITLRGEPGLDDEPQHELMGRITGSLLETLSVPWAYFPDRPNDVEAALARADDVLTREERPYALIMRKGAVAPHALPAACATVDHKKCFSSHTHLFQRSRADWPSRTEMLARVIELTGMRETVVIATTGYTGRELFALDDRANHFYVVGSMGCASAIGLGLAMARPDLRVVVLDGDGAALMRLGNFATLGAYGGDNLVHLVLDNEAHDSTGGQATVSPGVSFAGIARACGYPVTFEGDDLSLLDGLLAVGPGPRFGHFKIRPGAPDRLPRPDLRPHEVRERLMRHLVLSKQ